MPLRLKALRVRLLFRLSIKVDDIAASIGRWVDDRSIAIQTRIGAIADRVHHAACDAQDQYELEATTDVVAAVVSAPRLEAA